MPPTVEQVRVLADNCEQFRDSKAPLGYPNSLALCVVDSVQSTGVTYPSVEKVIHRYCDFRRSRGHDPYTDGVHALLATFHEVGDPTAWARRIGNQNKISTHAGAPLKAVAVHEAAQALSRHIVVTTQDLRDAAE
ncbi:hypothetical protein ACQPW1_29185 [Nocardia sp. CA-128927]|uniref:hypothetical protein n=1 Tax=Nocardia sp. CA-128927 TaxID=3239975 RepID=UPI003D9608D0